MFANEDCNDELISPSSKSLVIVFNYFDVYLYLQEFFDRYFVEYYRRPPKQQTHRIVFLQNFQKFHKDVQSTIRNLHAQFHEALQSSSRDNERFLNSHLTK